MFPQNVVADGVHKRAQTLRLTNPAFAAQSGKNAGKGLLPHILDRMRRRQARTKLELNQFAEIRNEMFLRAKVSRTETLQVGLVKRLELQGLPLMRCRSG